MAVAWSQTLYHSCYELGHCWTPHCKDAVGGLGWHAFKYSLKVYGTLYLLAAILRRRKPAYFKGRLIPETVRSALFLAVNVALFIGSFCLWRKLFPYIFLNAFVVGLPVSAFAYHLESPDRGVVGHATFLTAGFLPGIIASFSAILLERKQRRGMLALYLLNLAMETAFKMAVSRGMVRSVKHGEVLLFSLVMSVYVYMYKKNALQESTKRLLSFFIGRTELPPGGQPRSLTGPGPSVVMETETGASGARTDLEQTATETGSAAKRSGTLTSYLPKNVKALIALWRLGPKHRLCHHRHNCLANGLESGVRLFVLGTAVQTTLRLVRSVTSALRRPRALLEAVTSRDNVKLGLFLGTFTSVLKLVHCLLRWARDKDSPAHGLISGFLAGWSMLWYRSSTIAMWLTSKLAEILYFKGIEAGLVPYLTHGDVLVYSLSTAFVLHAAVFEPHNIRPAYWKFLLGLTDQKFGMMNRKLLDVYGTSASKLYADYWPSYDKRFTDL